MLLPDMAYAYLIVDVHFICIAICSTHESVSTLSCSPGRWDHFKGVALRCVLHIAQGPSTCMAAGYHDAVRCGPLHLDCPHVQGSEASGTSGKPVSGTLPFDRESLPVLSQEGQSLLCDEYLLLGKREKSKLQYAATKVVREHYNSDIECRYGLLCLTTTRALGLLNLITMNPLRIAFNFISLL